MNRATESVANGGGRPNGDGPNADDVTCWIADAGRGDADAQARVWERYFGRLVEFAKQRLAPKIRRVTDGDDVAASAMFSFYDGLAAGRFALADRGELWRLLLTITSRKAVSASRRERSQKRGGGAQRGESVFLREGEEAIGGIGGIADDAPTPEMEVMVAENCQRLLAILPDESLRRVAVLRLEGYTSDEIAEKLGVVTRTVTRKLDLIRSAWEAEAGR